MRARARRRFRVVQIKGPGAPSLDLLPLQFFPNSPLPSLGWDHAPTRPRRPTIITTMTAQALPGQRPTLYDLTNRENASR
jgi:hypothetical protein